MMNEDMKTVIFTCDAADDVYNDEGTMERLLNGEKVMWKIWYNGDRRHLPTKTAEGDRFFILQKDTGIVACGAVGNIDFKRGKAKLSSCGMVDIELKPEKVGRPVLIIKLLDKIMSLTKLSLNHNELILDKKSICFQLEEMWLKAILEYNTSKDSIPDDYWKPAHLHPMTAEALHYSILTDHPVCPCCGGPLSDDDDLFFQPSLIKSTCKQITSFDELKAQYTILCKDCASIEKELH